MKRYVLIGEMSFGAFLVDTLFCCGCQQVDVAGSVPGV